MSAAGEPVIGIDLGTSNSAAAVVVGGVPRVVPNRSGLLLTPSVVAVAANGKRLVGGMARRQAITNPTDTVFAAKRLIGRRWGSREVEDARKVLPYALEPGPDGNDVRIRMGGRTWAIPEISGMVLAELKADVEAFLGCPVTRAVVTVPAYFNDGQRQATKDAGRIAGLEVMRIVNEPTSAALAYGYGRDIAEKVVVFDLGGGTFDVSILDIGKGVYDVVAVGGDTYLGGEDFDRRLVDWLASDFAEENGGIDLRQDRMALQRLKDAAEKAKCHLSEATSAAVHLPFLAGGGEGRPALHLQKEVRRDRLEELTHDLVERCLQATGRTLRDAGLRPADVGEVILVGGMTRMPMIQKGVRELFGREPSRAVHPEEVVALGAAIQAHALAYPQEAASDVLLLDVTPQNLGIMVVGGYFQTVIPRNTSVPTQQTHVFTTAHDDQASVRIAVLQGASDKAVENELLGEFVLGGIRKARRGEVEVEVAFDVSAEGILSVSALDLATGQRQSIQVTATSGLSEEELRRITSAGAEELLARKQETAEVERRSEAVRGAATEIESLVPAVTAALSRSRIGNDAIDKARAMLQRVKAAVEGRDAASLTDLEQQLDRTLQLFKAIAASGGGAEGR